MGGFTNPAAPPPPLPPIHYSPSAPFNNPASPAPGLGGILKNTVQPNTLPPIPVAGGAPIASPLSPATGLGSALAGTLQPNYTYTPAPYQPTANFGLSDEREKVDVTNPSPEHTQQFMDALHAHSYRYKDPEAAGAGAGTYVSPMAQEMEKSPLGQHFVFQGPDGHKMVDYAKMAGTQLAASAMLNERVNGLEDLLRRSAALRPQRSAMPADAR
jgi:hypothetical protein